MMEAVLSYIRSWFPISKNSSTTRKRRADNSLIYVSPKQRRVLSPVFNNFDVDWFSNSPYHSPRIVLNNVSPIQSITIDDDDLIEIIEPIKKYKKRYTSTPSENSKPKMQTNKDSNSINLDDDDVILIGKTKSTIENRDDAKKVDCSYITPFSRSFESNNCNEIGKFVNENHSSKKSQINNSSLDYSFRLEDKIKYKELLDKMTKQNSSSSSIYYTPTGKLFNHYVSNRSKQILNLARKSSIASKQDYDVVDLTLNDNKKKLTTKDTVIKILDDFNNAVVVDNANDDDSDVEILPTPPSPKPDIKVDRVNSFKKIVDTSKSTNPDHIQNMYDDYCCFIKSKQQEIDDINKHSAKLNKINQELRLESLNRKVNKCLAIKEAILPLEDWDVEIKLPQLTDKHLEIINSGLNGNRNEILTKKFNINITRRDIQTLDGLTWLNDNIINFYMNLIIERGSDPKWPKTHCMNTFFYQKLIKDGPESLRRWTRRIDIFSYDLICIPIHLGVHWCMAIIYLNESSIKYYDSMGGSNNQCLQALKNYLEYEHLDKKKEPYNTDHFELENVKNIPQQMNGSDCGVFSCTFAEFASRKSKFTFSQEKMPYLRKKMIYEILSGRLMIQ